MIDLNIIRHGIHKVHKHGLMHVIKKTLTANKSNSIPLYKLTIDSDNAIYGCEYKPSPCDEVHQAIESLPIKYNDYTFIDIGSGKGTVLKIALSYGFKKVIGIEFAHELVDIAKKTVPEAQSICCDATQYDFPTGKDVIYMYNPFERTVLTKVMSKIGALRDSEIYLIYLQCQDQDIVEKYSKHLSPEGWMQTFKVNSL